MADTTPSADIIEVTTVRTYTYTQDKLRRLLGFPLESEDVEMLAVEMDPLSRYVTFTMRGVGHGRIT